MKIAHWTLLNGSGLANVASDICEAEKKLGYDSVLCNTQVQATWEVGMDADIHVAHSHIPDKISLCTNAKIVVVQHGSPEHVFELSVSQGLTGAYGAGDNLAMVGFLLNRADAVVTFWPRQAEILKTMTKTPVYTIPMGIDRLFWKPVAKQKLLSGTPALLTAENCHTCKWPIDLMFMWPWVVRELPDARAHFLNIPFDQHRWWLPLAYMTGSRYTTFISPNKLPKDQLRQFLCAADFYYSPVEYGDFNRMSLEATACGCKVISYRGNEYAHYWIDEGDQRKQAEQLIEILKGNVTERPVLNIPDIDDTAKEMFNIYGGLS